MRLLKKILNIFRKILLIDELPSDILNSKENNNKYKEDDKYFYYEFTSKNRKIRYKRCKSAHKEYSTKILENTINEPSILFNKITFKDLSELLLKIAEDWHKNFNLGSIYPFLFIVNWEEDPHDYTTAEVNSKKELFDWLKDCGRPNDERVGVSPSIVQLSTSIPNFDIYFYRIDREGNTFDIRKENPLLNMDKELDFYVVFDVMDISTPKKLGSDEFNIKENDRMAKMLHYFIYEL